MTFRTQLRPKDLSLEDKLFFTNLPFFKEVNMWLDVGCGPHAHVSEAAMARHPGPAGYFPIDPALAGKLAEERSLVGDRAMLTWKDAVEKLAGAVRPGPVRAALFSSVIHEMFSLDGHYGKPDPKQFWLDVASTGADYVIVRDMCLQCDPRAMLTAASCRSMLLALEQATYLAGMRGLDKKYTNDLVDRVNKDIPKGIPSLTSRTLLREFLQFTLQNQWGEGRVSEEMKENYFALDAKAFDLAAQAVDYIPIHLKHYTLDHFKDPKHPASRVLNECPEANITTHIQAVYKKDNAAGATGTLH